MKAVIFDIDGTLLESMAIDTAMYLSSIREVLGPVEIREDLNHYDHVTDLGIISQIISDNGLSHGQDALDAIRELFMTGLRNHIGCNGPFPNIEGAPEYFERLNKRADHRVAIATGGWRQSAFLKLTSAGFDIDGIPLATSDDALSREDIMLTALRQLDSTFDSVTYFGDAEWDRRACESLGWEFVAVGPRLGGINSYREVW